MKDYILKDKTPATDKNSFLTGLVFGFDVGTGSIGYAVRRGAEFKDVGVLICDSEGSDLSKRRDLRRQRRTLRSKKFRRQWFAQELVKLGLLKPQTALDDPISLRLRALNGEVLKPEELHAALTHLFKRRGYSKVPWANVEKATKETAKPKKDDDEGIIIEAVKEMKTKLGDKHPCQFLAEERARVGSSPTTNWARKIYWPREVLRDEFLAIVQAQKKSFPELETKSGWLLYGDSQSKEKNGETFHVFFKTTEARNPGVLGLRWPRFDNRGPALDSLQPVDEQGRPMHVVRKNKEAFIQAQWAMALLNLRVQNSNTREKFPPSGNALAKLREVWEKQQAKNAKRKTKKPDESDGESSDENEDITITRAVLKQWVKVCQEELKENFALIEGQRDLTPKTGAGRARFNSQNLAKIQKDIEAGKGMPSAQTILRRDGETNEEALNRYLRDIEHPLVRHRLALIRKLISDPKNGLIARFGVPDCVVVEAIRKLAMSDNAKRRLQAWQDTREEETDAALTFWRERDNANPQKKSLEKWKLWRELSFEKTRASRCPYCLQPIISSADETIEVEHIVPYRRVFCNEFYNKTVAHRDCNATKGNQTPYEAFAHNPNWPVRWSNEKDLDDPDTIVGNARRCFRREFHFSYQHMAKINGKTVMRSKKDSAVNSKTKLDLFISPNAEALVEEKSDVVQTAYIAKVLRHVCLLEFDRPNQRWLNEDGTDPTDEKGNHPSQCYLVTNGSLTSRLRKAWGLNQILHPLPPGKKWDDLTDEEKTQLTEKNRGDLRHHSLDAMVIACTLPWLAHRTHGAKDSFGRPGWWWLDEKKRSRASNPIFPNEGQMHEVVKKEIEKVAVKHHVSRSNHQRGYDLTIYGRPKKNSVPIPNCYVSREPITSLKPSDLKSSKTGKSKVFPPLLGDYLALAWEKFCEVEPNWEKLLKANKDSLPEAFQKRLCFSDFQRWRQDDAPTFRWPDKVVIPIKRVGYIGVENDNAVAPASPGTHGFVARGGRKPLLEVRLHPSADGKSLVPVFVPSWRMDKPIPKAPIKPDSESVATIRRGQIVEIKNSPSRNTPVGKYRIASTMQKNIQLLPVHLADSKEALKASGFLENGVNISWDTFIKSAGYELPHPPPVKPQS